MLVVVIMESFSLDDNNTCYSYVLSQALLNCYSKRDHEKSLHNKYNFMQQSSL